MTDDLPLSRPLRVAEIPSGGRRMTVETSEAERKAVADLLDLPAIYELRAELELTPFHADGIAVTGLIDARLAQTCVVSLDPFDIAVKAPIAVRFSPDGRDPNDPDIPIEELLDPDAQEPPDLMVDGRIDLGDIVVEFLALGLDPYPRKPGAVFAAPEPEQERSPFAALLALKKDV